jgi:hypothetical protein
VSNPYSGGSGASFDRNHTPVDIRQSFGNSGSFSGIGFSATIDGMKLVAQISQPFGLLSLRRQDRRRLHHSADVRRALNLGRRPTS